MSELQELDRASVIEGPVTPVLAARIEHASAWKVADFRKDRVNNPWCFSSRRRSLARAAYQAPEQLRGETQISPKADLYSLGCLLFHMITGRPPFIADELDELIEQQLNAAPPRVTTSLPKEWFTF